MSVNKNTNGSIMIAALIVTLITGSLVGFFLKTVTQEAKNSYRSNMAFQAVNLAEAGLEFAIYSVRSGDWDGWTAKGSTYYRDSFPHVNYSFRRENRAVRVYARPGDSPPRVVAEGIIQTPSGMSITRQIYIELGNSSLFANGVLAKRNLKFNGQNIAIDSYKSSDAIYTRYSNGSVASLSISEDDLNLGNADIWGTAATGGSLASEVTILKRGSVRGEDTEAGVRIDLDRIATDFMATLPDPEIITFSSYDTLPTATTVGSFEVYEFGTDDTAIETYNFADLEVKKDDVMLLYGDVVINVENDVDINGSVILARKGDLLPDGTAVTRDATLELNVGDDMWVGGPAASFVNGGVVPTEILDRGSQDPDAPENKVGLPTNVLVTSFGTYTGTDYPEFTLHGNGSFAGAVYAPNALISLDGSGGAGEYYGAVVGLEITFGGGYQFHYDEDLADLEDESAKKVTRWVELTDAGERKNMSTILNDGL
jgi:hypothetical protein